MKQVISRFSLLGLAVTGFGSVVIALTCFIGQPASVAQAACVALPTDKGQATFTVNIPTAGSYRVWSRLYAPSSTANGIYMQIDQTSCNVIVGHGGPIPAGQLTWVDWLSGNQATKFDVTLTAGNHTVIAAGLDANVGLDEIMFVSDKACVPVGNGSNCASGAASVTPVPQPSTTPVVVGGTKTPAPVSGVIDLAPNDSDAVSTTYVVDGKALTGSQLDTTKLSDGKHTVDVITKLANGQVTTTKQTIEVQNGWQYKLVAGMRKNWYWAVGGVVLLVLILAGGYVAWRNRLKWFHKTTPASGGQATKAATPAGTIIAPASVQPPAATPEAAPEGTQAPDQANRNQ